MQNRLQASQLGVFKLYGILSWLQRVLPSGLVSKLLYKPHINFCT